MNILIVDDETRFAAALARSLGKTGDAIACAGSAEEALEQLASAPADLVITDLRLPRRSGLDLLGEVSSRWPLTQVLLMTAYAEVDTARTALKRGALDYLVKPFDHAELAGLVEQARARLPPPVAGAIAEPAIAGLVGASPAMRRIQAEIRHAAASSSTVLLLGESGTGKEVAARALHLLSPRSDGPFIDIHTAALPEHLIESELFGHERGAFTGADSKKPGLFELAAGGTAFLDEIGELPLAMQTKLLRFLQERRFRRVGGTTEVAVEVRIVAATNRDLRAEVDAKRFRADLFYRLDVLSLTMPPLRERREDIPLLVRHLLAKQGRTAIVSEAIEALIAYDWPGNVRELANVIERAGVLAGAGAITLDHLVDRVRHAETRMAAEQNEESDLHLSEQQRQLILTALERAAGNKTRAAELLGITRRRLYSRMKILGLAQDGEHETGSHVRLPAVRR